jgi:hypothetical protein
MTLLLQQHQLKRLEGCKKKIGENGIPTELKNPA